MAKKKPVKGTKKPKGGATTQGDSQPNPPPPPPKP